MSDYWEIKRGNTAIQDIPIEDEDGNLLTDLSEVTVAKFQLKKTKTSESALIEKTLGAGIVVNTPSTGYIRLTLTPLDTKKIPEGFYYVGLELIWTADVKEYEIDFLIDNRETESCKVVGDVVN